MRLRAAECDILVVAPILACGTAAETRTAVAPIGLPALLNAGGAVRSVEVTADGACTVQLRGTGRLLVWADARPAAVTIGGAAAHFAYDGAACRLEVEVSAEVSLDSVVVLVF